MIRLGNMRSPPTWLPVLTIFSTLLPLISPAGDTISPGDSVSDSGFLVSAAEGFRLGFFTPGKSKFRYLGIWYNTVSPKTVVWVANRDRPLPDSTGVLSISTNGRLVLSDAKGVVYWSTDEVNVANPVAKLLNNANFVVTSSGGSGTLGSYAWQSFDYPTDSLLPGMKIGWDLRAGRNRKFTAWRSADDPATGDYSVVMDIRGDPQIFLVKGKAQLWRSGPWIGDYFSGDPGVLAQGKAQQWNVFYSGADEVYFQFNIPDSLLLFRVVVQPAGMVQTVVWMAGSKTWYVFSSIPKDRCDNVSHCGPFGVCDTNDSPICSCLQGFDPRSPQNRYLWEAKDGCTRRTPLDCRNGADGFIRLAGVKLPDTSAAVVNQSMGLDECGATCLRNCSCTAYSNALVTGGGSGCILWGGDLTDLRVLTNGGQDLFVRVASADASLNKKTASPSEVHRKWEAAVIAGAAVLASLLLGWLSWCMWRRKHMRVLLDTTTRKSGHRNQESSTVNDLEMPLFDFSTISSATGCFSAENKLGEGGFGPVYVGRLGEGQEVAVKRLSRNSVQGLDQFKNEVMLIAKLQHRNLVRLLGCCIQGEERMLIYEYMPNKSLDAFLFDKTKGPLLDWKTRYHIINGIARGLLYLHQDSRLRIIHRDLKAGNILLDKDMNPKISDFGMATICGGDETEANTKRVVGTYGYMSPEYMIDGIFSVKSDVYSFGVVVLEIVTGKRNRAMYLSDPNLNLLGYAWSLWKAGKELELVDSSMACSFPMREVLKCIKVGLLCVQQCPEDRPTMASVVHILGSDTMVLPQPKQPGFVVMRGPYEVISPSSCSVNDVTITELNGR